MATSNPRRPAQEAFVSRGGALAIGFFGMGAVLALVIATVLLWPGMSAGMFARGWLGLGCSALAGGVTARSLGRWSARGVLIGGEGTTRGVVTGWMSLVAATGAGLLANALTSGSLESGHLNPWSGLLLYVLAVGSVPASILGWIYGRALIKGLARVSLVE